MIDPVTALALAGTAFNGIKKAVQLGKDVQDVYAQLSKWAGHVADVHEHMTQNPKKPGLFEKIGFAKSATAEAFDHLIAQQKLKEMEKEIKHMFIWGELQHLGMDGYKELIRKRRQIKADREKQIYDQLRKRKMFFNIIKQSIIGGVAVLASISLVWWMIDLIMGAPGIQG
tara:strand:+ start:1939 stop:2451 length:513 start_codon:yes stop_codon:yes gene_type:complete